MIRNIFRTISLLSALLATSLATGPQAFGCDEGFMDVNNALIKTAPDELLLELQKTRASVKEALRGALEKKFVSEYKELETLKREASAAGYLGYDIADEAFNASFELNFQRNLIEQYLKTMPIPTTATDHYMDHGKKHVLWTSRDTCAVAGYFGELPLEQWHERWAGPHTAVPFTQVVSANRQPTDYLFGMTKAEEIHMRGVAYLASLYAHVFQKRNDYKMMVFGK